VARGHETEKQRLQRKGAVIGTTVAPGPGTVGGYVAGGYVANKRLELSQKRDAMGRYTKLGGVLSETASTTREQQRGVRRPMVSAPKPPTIKPTLVKTPKPPTPQVQPATQTPVMSSIAKEGAISAIKKLRARKAVGDMGEPQQLWRGNRVRRQRPGPENEPEPESWRGHDF
jgi:hypothetical protein